MHLSALFCISASAHNNQPRDTSTYPCSLHLRSLKSTNCISLLSPVSMHPIPRTTNSPETPAHISLLSGDQHTASLCSLMANTMHLFSVHTHFLCTSALWSTQCISVPYGQYNASLCSLDGHDISLLPCSQDKIVLHLSATTVSGVWSTHKGERKVAASFKHCCLISTSLCCVIIMSHCTPIAYSSVVYPLITLYHYCINHALYHT